MTADPTSEAASLRGGAIVVENLTKVFQSDRRRPPFRAVDGISFTVARGEIFGCLGPNGAGKTTTIRILLGLLRPSGGTVKALGLSLPAEARTLHARTGYMSQRFTLYDDLTASENLRFYGRAYGLAGRQLRSRFESMVSMAGLSGLENELARNLPGGWRQRLALGCAIIHDPELIFLDEPTAGVDPAARRELWELIYGLADRGKTIFVTTHYMDEAELCQRLAFMARGRIAAIGTPDALKNAHAGGPILELDCDQPERALALVAQAQRDSERFDGRLRVAGLTMLGDIVHVALHHDMGPSDVTAYGGSHAAEQASRIAGLLATAGVDVRSLHVVAPSIEEVFIATTGETAETRDTA